MASLILLRNPLAPHSREIHPLAAGTRVIDWLQEHHPQGFGMPIRFYVNGGEKPIDDLDYVLQLHDVAAIALMPASPDGGVLESILISLAISAVLSAASFALNYLFAPKERSGGRNKAVGVYDVSGDQNAAALGAPIPVVYGTVLTTPDYVSQPYSFFSWSQQSFYDANYSGIQYLDMILCVGQGNIDVSEIYLGDTATATPPAGVVTWRAFKPVDHAKTMGRIASAMGGGFHENVVTSPEVSNQEFVKDGDSAGYFASCKAGNKGSKFQIDIVFPGGQTNPNSTGDIHGRLTQFSVSYQELDDSDNLIGTVYSQTITASTDNSNTVTGPDMSNVVTTSTDETNMSVISGPLRRSYMVTAPKSARWAVKLTRISNTPNSKAGTDRFIWSGLKLYADYPSGSVYGNTTLIAVRIRASQGLGEAASARIRVKCTRRLRPPAGGTEAPSTSAADAFADVYTDSVYGAARPRTELDTVTLAALRTKWNGYSFNYVFKDKITVWEALRTITTPFAAEPLPIGAMMSVAQDGIKSARTALFTDGNIVDDSLSIDYSWDEEGATDGVEIEYLDPKDFRQVYTRYPTTALRPDQFTVPGITNATHAAQFALLTWQRRQGQRKKVKFDTELEGLLVQMGDRIGIAHNVPKWGDSGLIIGQSGLTLVADKDLDWSGGAKQIILRKPDGGATAAITVTRGAQDNQIILPAAAPTTINYDGDYDYTSFAFGSASALVRDFVVTAVTPNGDNKVTVEGVNYDPTIFAGAMSYL